MKDQRGSWKDFTGICFERLPHNLPVFYFVNKYLWGTSSNYVNLERGASTKNRCVVGKSEWVRELYTTLHNGLYRAGSAQALYPRSLKPHFWGRWIWVYVLAYQNGPYIISSTSMIPLSSPYIPCQTLKSDPNIVLGSAGLATY